MKNLLSPVLWDNNTAYQVRVFSAYLAKLITCQCGVIIYKSVNYQQKKHRNLNKENHFFYQITNKQNF